MNSLIQHESLLIGSTQAIQDLAQKDTASLLVVSDSHGAWRNLAFILQEWGKHSDALVFCGDGGTDIVQILHMAKQSPEFAQHLPPVICMVEGNNDYDSLPIHDLSKDWDSEDKTRISLKVPLTQTFTAAGHNVFVTHGHRYNLYSGTSSLIDSSWIYDPDLILFGHTHVASYQTAPHNITVANPGSCNRPRALQPPTLARIALLKDRDIDSIRFYQFIPNGSRLYDGAREIPLI